MKKLLLFVTMAASLLFTQCKKEDSVSSVGKTVTMTVTAGPGSKTDITDAGAITWSAGDKLYVGDGSKYIGYLTLKSGAGSATGVFSGNVTLPTDTKDGVKPFHFFYLGSETPMGLAEGATSVEVKFDSQTGLREDLGSCHVGYGSATGTVINDVVTDINVTMLSKVAIARFDFKKGTDAYTGALKLSGDNIYSTMTVKFNSTGFACEGTEGEISLTNTTSSEKYVMLVPTDETTGEQILTFADANVSGSYTLANGIEANKFYGLTGAIAVTLEAAAPAGRFTVDANGTKVDFAPGNLWYGKAGDDETAAFHFEANQWGTQPESDGSWNENHVSHFLWSPSKDVAVSTSTSVSGGSSDVFFTNATATTANSSFQVDGEDAGTWRTLSKDEWVYLIYTRSGNRFAKAKVSDVQGLLIFPDNYSGTTSGNGIATVNITNAAYPGDNIHDGTWASMEALGVVFLPAAGLRYGTDVYYVACSYGYYWSSWSSTPIGTDYACYLYFDSDDIDPQYYNYRVNGSAVRLVR